MHIRPYEQPDAAAILSIWYEASRLAHPFLTESTLQCHRTLIQQHYLDQSAIWVMDNGNQISGFMGLFEHFIGALFIAPHFQRQGIGHMLLQHAHRFYSTLEVEVYTDNKLGRSFYCKEGFKEVSRRIDTGITPPLEAILMRSTRCFT